MCLLQVLQRMPPPRRRLVIFKGGGYVYAELEAAIESWGLGHVLRLTNLMRKAACVIARPAWDNGRRVNVKVRLVFHSCVHVYMCVT